MTEPMTPDKIAEIRSWISLWLRRENAEAISALCDAWVEVKEKYTTAEKDVCQLRDEIRSASEALDRYGQHEPECEAYCVEEPGECECELDLHRDAAARSASEESGDV